MNTHRLKIKEIFPWLLVLGWMGLIFYFSHQPATNSSNLSSGITQLVFKFIQKLIPNITLDFEFFHYIVRKGAHFTIYLILGIFVINAISKVEISSENRYKAVIIALLICVLYAVSDELHQVFIPGRAGQIKDVIIDSAGAIVGIAISQIKYYNYLNIK